MGFNSGFKGLIPVIVTDYAHRKTSYLYNSKVDMKI